MPDLLGTFEQIILLAVLGLGDEAYGRSVLREAGSALSGGQRLSAGAVYSTLDRLEVKGLLASVVEEGTASRAGRSRRFYRLTASGAKALTHTRNAMETMWRGKQWPLDATL